MHQAIAASSEPKGKAPLRQCPSDFDVIFVEKGREACESWYRARKTTVTRWLVERGKDRLVTERAAYVASQRKAGRWITRSTCMTAVRVVKASRPQPVRDRRRVSLTLARHAAQFLRISRNGGFTISIAGDNDWWVGSRRLSAAQLVDLAVGKGFDARRSFEPTEHEYPQADETKKGR